LSVQALSSTLRRLVLGQFAELPALRMIRQSADQIRERAERVVHALQDLRASIEPGQSVIGGGATPEQPIPTYLIAIACDDVVKVERRLRGRTPAIIARIEHNRLVIDLRTVLETEEPELTQALLDALGQNP
jgi:L-seryl-tRNA(Ser) seleniumtransferase